MIDFFLNLHKFIFIKFAHLLNLKNHKIDWLKKKNWKFENYEIWKVIKNWSLKIGEKENKICVQIIRKVKKSENLKSDEENAENLKKEAIPKNCRKWLLRENLPLFHKCSKTYRNSEEISKKVWENF